MSSSRNKDGRELTEAEAWKLMMDSMIKFISASTKLMTTITDRAAASEDKKCEKECIICPTRSKKECGVCAATKSVEMQKLKSLENSLVTDLTAASTKENDPAIETQKAPEDPAKTDESPPVPKEDAPAEPAAKTEGEDTKAKDDKPEPDKRTETKDNDQAVDLSNCVCSEVRLLKEEASKSGVNVDKKRKRRKDRKDPSASAVSRSGKTSEADVDGTGERSLCACDVGPNEKAQMTNDLANKINQAQENLAQLQVEMARLQQLESGKHSQSAALYRQIMKDSSLDTPTVSGNVTDGTSKTSQQSTSKTSPPADDSRQARLGSVRRTLQYDDDPCTEISCPQKNTTRSSNQKNMQQSNGVPNYSKVGGGPQIIAGYMEAPISPIFPTGYKSGVSDYNGFPTESTPLTPKPGSYYAGDVTPKKAGLSSSQYSATPQAPQSRRIRPPIYSRKSPTPQLDQAFISQNEELDDADALNEPLEYNGSQSCNAYISKQVSHSQSLRYPRSQSAPYSASSLRGRGIPQMESMSYPRTQSMRSSPHSYQQMPPSPFRDVVENQNMYPVPYTSILDQQVAETVAYINPEFATESEEFPGEECFDDSCENECLA